MKFSIITVCLNSEKTIEKTIHSVISQKNIEMEYIIIDGVSSDRTLDIVNKYNDQIDIIVSEPDKGIYDAMNKGIQLSSGDIIGIINSDDWYEPNALEIVNKCFESNKDIGIIYGDLNLVNQYSIEKMKNVEFKTIWYQMAVNHPACFVKKEIYNMLGLYSMKYDIASDFEWINRAFFSRVKFAHINHILANFRMDGISNRLLNKCIEESDMISDINFKFDLFEKTNYTLDVVKEEAIYLFGAGVYGKKFALYYKKAGFNICGIIDNDVNKQGTEIDGYNIISVKDIGESGTIIIATLKYADQIMNQLVEEKKDLKIITLQQIFDVYGEYVVEKYGVCKELNIPVC